LNRDVDEEECQATNKIVDVQHGTADVMWLCFLICGLLVFTVDTFKSNISVPWSKEFTLVGSRREDEEGE
jgi:hypothetical protein